MLEEYPEFGHCCTIDDLHQLRNIHILITLEAFVRHMTLMGKFFEYILGMLMTLIASKEHTRFFSQR